MEGSKSLVIVNRLSRGKAGTGEKKVVCDWCLQRFVVFERGSEAASRPRRESRARSSGGCTSTLFSHAVEQGTADPPATTVNRVQDDFAASSSKSSTHLGLVSHFRRVRNTSGFVDFSICALFTLQCIYKNGGLQVQRLTETVSRHKYAIVQKRIQRAR